MKTQDLLDELDRRKLTVKITQDGRTVLVGKGFRVTPTLLAVLRWHKAELLKLISPEVIESKVPVLREWLWRDGHKYAETPDDTWLFGVAERHPVGAWWWRQVGQAAWQAVPGCEEAIAGLMVDAR